MDNDGITIISSYRPALLSSLVCALSFLQDLVSLMCVLLSFMLHLLRLKSVLLHKLKPEVTVINQISAQIVRVYCFVCKTLLTCCAQTPGPLCSSQLGSRCGSSPSLGAPPAPAPTPPPPHPRPRLRPHPPHLLRPSSGSSTPVWLSARHLVPLPNGRGVWADEGSHPGRCSPSRTCARGARMQRSDRTWAGLLRAALRRHRPRPPPSAALKGQSVKDGALIKTFRCSLLRILMVFHCMFKPQTSPKKNQSNLVGFFSPTTFRYDTVTAADTAVQHTIIKFNNAQVKIFLWVKKNKSASS